MINNLYLDILKEELVLAQGCTEPISLAYASAICRETLGHLPTHVRIKASGNILKNAKSVVVPNTNGLKGLKASILIGMVGGKSNLLLEVISQVTPEDIALTNKLMQEDFVEIELLETPATLHFIVEFSDGKDVVSCEIKHLHTNVVAIKRNDEVIFENYCDDINFNNPLTDRSILSVEKIYEFSDQVDLSLIGSLIDEQIKYNTAIAIEGLTNDYGIKVGKTLLKYAPYNIETQVKAFGAAGSDARMNGSTFPVMTNSGSGNQGMSASNPLIKYCEIKGYDHESLTRALLLSNLITIHIKTGISRLSCFCGAVVANCGVAAGLTYLETKNVEKVKMAIQNVLANISGILCDGAKESCPQKIASSIDAAFQAYYLALDDLVVSNGCGYIESDVEKTIKNIGIIGKDGMKETDRTILDIMTKIKN